MEKENEIIKSAATTLNLSKTDVKILNTLHNSKKLLVKEITEKIKCSERHVRQRLHFLLQKGFLKKEIQVLNNKRIAYTYSLKSLKKIAREIQNILYKKIDELEKISSE